MLPEEDQWKPDFRAEVLMYEEYCRFSAVILKFLKDLYMAVCRNRRNLPLSIMLVPHIILPCISPQILLASWLNPLAFPIEAAGKPGPRRRGHHQIR